MCLDLVLERLQLNPFRFFFTFKKKVSLSATRTLCWCCINPADDEKRERRKEKRERKKTCSKINDGQRWFHVLLLMAVYINRGWCMCHYFTNDSKSELFFDDCFTVWCDLDPTDEGLVFIAWWRRHWVRVWCDMYVWLTIEVFIGLQTRVCRDKTFVVTKLIIDNWY